MFDDSDKIPKAWFHASATALSIAEFARSDILLYRAKLVEGERHLGPYVLPSFQRPLVWTEEQKVRLIDSLWNNLPIGSYIYNDAGLDHPCDGWLLDGQQRITSIIEYVNDSFEVFGYYYSQIAKREKRCFMMKPIGCYITKLTNEDTCREIYDRLAYGGTPHDSPTKL